MFTDQLNAAIDTAQPNQCDALAHDLWRAYAAGHMTDQEATDAAARIAQNSPLVYRAHLAPARNLSDEPKLCAPGSPSQDHAAAF
jgi:hypothetical protein